MANFLAASLIIFAVLAGGLRVSIEGCLASCALLLLAFQCDSHLFFWIINWH